MLNFRFDEMYKYANQFYRRRHMFRDLGYYAVSG